ncbi:MAG: hypothetical protein IKK81_11420 [Prevotella sp.]|nr:hypothetical protein [Prevotella sp.]
MKTKTYLSLFVLFVFALLGGGSFDTGEIVFFVVIVFIAIVAGILDNNKKVAKEEEKRLKEEAELKLRIEEYQVQKNNFINKKGEPDKTIIIKEYDLNSEINVYEKDKEIYILGKKYSFKEIMSCQLSDNSRVVKGNITAITESKTGSMIGRAVVGDLVAGPAGAIIGGTTGKKQTEIKQEDDVTVHDYTVYVNVDSISNPVETINVGNNGNLANEILGLFNIIISRNNVMK